MNLKALLERLSVAFDLSPAVVDVHGSVSYRELGEKINRYSDFLDSVSMRNILIIPQQTADSIALVFATICHNTTPFIADPAWSLADIMDIVSIYGIDAIVACGDVEQLQSEDALNKVIAGEASISIMRTSLYGSSGIGTREDTALVRFSSGSTGRARALEFTEQACIEAASAWRTSACIQADQRVFCLATLNNGLAFNTSLLAVFVVGACLYLHGGQLLPKAILRKIAEIQPNYIVGFPFIFDLLCKSKAALQKNVPKDTIAISSAAPLSGTTNELWRAQTGRYIGQYYGTAECGPVTFNSGRRASSGYPLDGVAIKILAEPSGQSPFPVGQVAIRTHSMASDYIPDGGSRIIDDIDEEGFFITKDIGYLNDNNELFILGRKDRVININGKKIDPVEIENCISQLSGVEHCIVEQSKCSKNQIIAYIESQSLNTCEILRHCITNLSAVKIPHHFYINDHFPRSSTGKIRLQKLRELID